MEQATTLLLVVEVWDKKIDKRCVAAADFTESIADPADVAGIAVGTLCRQQQLPWLSTPLHLCIAPCDNHAVPCALSSWCACTCAASACM